MRTKLTNRITGALVVMALAAASPLAFGQQQNSDNQTMMQSGSPTGGAGMMGGCDPGTMGPGGGMGMGPGMMGGGMMGGGMMGGAGMMGPGMMGGGMMGGTGMMGPGMMGGGFGPLGALGLSADQQRKINSVQDDLRKQHWNLLGQIQDQQAALRNLYAADKVDSKKIGEAYGKIGDLQRQMAESHAQALNQVRAALTPEQRQQLSQMQRGFRGPAYGAPGGPGGGMMNR